MRLCKVRTGQGSSSTKLHIRIILHFGSWLRNMAAADADDRHSTLLRQHTGGSVALCLGAPAVPGKLQSLKMTIQAPLG
jgi:hypothetical protein